MRAICAALLIALAFALGLVLGAREVERITAGEVRR